MDLLSPQALKGKSTTVLFPVQFPEPGTGLAQLCQCCEVDEVWLDGWIYEWMNNWVGKWMDRWVGGYMDGWVDTWMDGWIHGWVGG